MKGLNKAIRAAIKKARKALKSAQASAARAEARHQAARIRRMLAAARRGKEAKGLKDLPQAKASAAAARLVEAAKEKIAALEKAL